MQTSTNQSDSCPHTRIPSRLKKFSLLESDLRSSLISEKRDKTHFPNSERQLMWQIHQLPLLLNTRENRWTKSLEGWRFKRDDSISKIKRKWNRTKREQHFDSLIECCKPTSIIAKRLMKQSDIFGLTDWSNMFRNMNPFERLQPVEDPLLLRELLSRNRFGVRSDLKDIKNLKVDGIDTSPKGIMERMFCAEISRESRREIKAEESANGRVGDKHITFGMDTVLEESKEQISVKEYASSFLEQLDTLPIAADTVEFQSLEPKTSIAKKGTVQKKTAEHFRGMMFKRLVPEQIADDRGPEVMVAVTDKLGERWVRLQFGIEKFPKRKAGPETISIGIQVDEKELIIEKYKESDLQPRMVITKGIIGKEKSDKPELKQRPESPETLFQRPQSWVEGRERFDFQNKRNLEIRKWNWTRREFMQPQLRSVAPAEIDQQITKPDTSQSRTIDKAIDRRYENIQRTASTLMMRHAKGIEMRGGARYRSSRGRNLLRNSTPVEWCRGVSRAFANQPSLND